MSSKLNETPSSWALKLFKNIFWRKNKNSFLAENKSGDCSSNINETDFYFDNSGFEQMPTSSVLEICNDTPDCETPAIELHDDYDCESYSTFHDAMVKLIPENNDFVSAASPHVFRKCFFESAEKDPNELFHLSLSPAISKRKLRRPLDYLNLEVTPKNIDLIVRNQLAQSLTSSSESALVNLERNMYPSFYQISEIDGSVAYEAIENDMTSKLKIVYNFIRLIGIMIFLFYIILFIACYFYISVMDLFFNFFKNVVEAFLVGQAPVDQKVFVHSRTGNGSSKDTTPKEAAVPVSDSLIKFSDDELPDVCPEQTTELISDVDCDVNSTPEIKDLSESQNDDAKYDNNISFARLPSKGYHSDETPLLRTMAVNRMIKSRSMDGDRQATSTPIIPSCRVPGGSVPFLFEHFSDSGGITCGDTPFVQAELKRIPNDLAVNELGLSSVSGILHEGRATPTSSFNAESNSSESGEDVYYDTDINQGISEASYEEHSALGIYVENCDPRYSNDFVRLEEYDKIICSDKNLVDPSFTSQNSSMNVNYCTSSLIHRSMPSNVFESNTKSIPDLEYSKNLSPICSYDYFSISDESSSSGPSADACFPPIEPKSIICSADSSNEPRAISSGSTELRPISFCSTEPRETSFCSNDPRSISSCSTQPIASPFSSTEPSTIPSCAISPRPISSDPTDPIAISSCPTEPKKATCSSTQPISNACSLTDSIVISCSSSAPTAVACCSSPSITPETSTEYDVTGLLLNSLSLEYSNDCIDAGQWTKSPISRKKPKDQKPTTYDNSIMIPNFEAAMASMQNENKGSRDTLITSFQSDDSGTLASCSFSNNCALPDYQRDASCDEAKIIPNADEDVISPTPKKKLGVKQRMSAMFRNWKSFRFPRRGILITPRSKRYERCMD